LSSDIYALRNCALTCRGWRPRAWYHLITSIRVRSKDDLYSIVDYIASSPRMSSIIR
ncbi:hypothetical protein OH76DRAFT_1303201, partial [Lentinus brumalis]